MSGFQTDVKFNKRDLPKKFRPEDVGDHLTALVSHINDMSAKLNNFVDDVRKASFGTETVVTTSSGIGGGGGGGGGGGTGPTHNWLSATHPDTIVDSPILGDMVAGNADPKWQKFAGNTTAVKLFLTQTGTGVVSAIPAWAAIVDGDIPTTLVRTSRTITINGTAARVSVAGGTQDLSANRTWTVDIDAAYVGQASITTLGTITTGVWNATKIGLAFGGTNADLSATGGAAQYLKQSSAGAAITVGTIPASDIASPAALTEVNDTNVTMALTGAPATALLQAVTMTLGWTGTLAAARLNANVVQSVVNDTNVTGSISAQTLTLGWTGTLAKARTLATTVYTDQANTFGAFVQTFQGGANHLITDTGDLTKKFQFDVSNVATATTRTVNIPDANSTTAQSISAVSHQFLTAMSAQGVFSQAQPSVSDISGGANLTLGTSLTSTAGTLTGILLAAVTINTIQGIRTVDSPTFNSVTTAGNVISSGGTSKIVVDGPDGSETSGEVSLWEFGGELRFSGRDSYRFALDNDNNTTSAFFRIYNNGLSGTLVLDMGENGDLKTAGYGRVGSVSAPTNTTAGDLTTTRLHLGVDGTQRGYVTLSGSTASTTQFLGQQSISTENTLASGSIVADTNLGSLAFYNNNGIVIAGITAHYATSANGSACYMSFKTGNTADRMRLLTNGHLLLGTTTDSAWAYIVQGASTSGSPIGLEFDGGAHTTLTIAETTDVNFNLARTVNFTSGGGTIATQRAFRIQAPTYSATTNAVTLTEASTVYIDGTPSAGSNVTITNAYALHVLGSMNLNYDGDQATAGIKIDHLNDAVIITGDTGGLGIFTTGLPSISDIEIGAFISAAGTRIVQVSRQYAADSTGCSLFIKAGGCTVGATNRVGGDLHLSSGISTGNGDSQIIFYTFTNTAGATSDNTRTERMRITGGSGILKIGGTASRGTTEGSIRIDLFNGTAPSGTLTNGASLYVTSGEMRVMDASGNATLISPHDKDGNWIYDSTDTVTGKRLRIDMEKFMRFLNNKFGTDFIHEYMETV